MVVQNTAQNFISKPFGAERRFRYEFICGPLLSCDFLNVRNEPSVGSSCFASICWHRSYLVFFVLFLAIVPHHFRICLFSIWAVLILLRIADLLVHFVLCYAQMLLSSSLLYCPAISTLAFLLVWSTKLPLPLLDALCCICLFSWCAQTSLNVFAQFVFDCWNLRERPLITAHRMLSRRFMLQHFVPISLHVFHLSWL